MISWYIMLKDGTLGLILPEGCIIHVTDNKQTGLE